MTTYTYNEAKEQFTELRKLLNLYDVLHIFGGVPYKDVHYYMPPYFASGYTMGEEVVVKCNGVIIDTIDRRKHYSKGCKWKAKHGRIVIDFTKKAMRQYVEICKSLCDENNIKNRSELVTKERALLEDALDLTESIMKAKGGGK